MRQDILVGVAVSALIHGGLFLESRLFPGKVPTPPPVATADVGPVITLTKYQDEEPTPAEATDRVKPVDFAPEMQPDRPQPRTDLSFIQPIQPPPPEGVKSNLGLTTVPDRQFRSDLGHLRIFDRTVLDQQPVARVTPPPTYPSDLRAQGITGEVIVDFIVDAAGNVQNAYAVRSTNRGFEAAAEQGVRRWKFRAGRKDGRAVYTHMQVPIRFNLNDGL